MSLAENLINSLDETTYENLRTVGGGYEEAHIVVNADRSITVPNSLKTIAVEGDKDVETVTIDCVRFWDENDLSTFEIDLNYILPNGDRWTYHPEEIYNITEDTFSFDFIIGSEITYAQGKLTFWIVAKMKDDDGTLIKQWSSLQNGDCSIAQGGDKGEIYSPYEEGYNDGKKAECDAFWDEYQTNGTRSKYEYAFASYGWTDKTFNPKYDIICGFAYSATSMFHNSLITDVQGILEKKGLILDTSKTYLNSFAQYSLSKRWGVIDATYCANSSSAFGYAFASAHCETIDKLIVNDKVVTTNGFNNADKLTNITIEGTIGKNFDIHWSPLSYDSIVSIISHLSDTATGQTLTLSKAAVNKAFETSESANDGSTSAGWQALVASKPNWTFSLI